MSTSVGSIIGGVFIGIILTVFISLILAIACSKQIIRFILRPPSQLEGIEMISQRLTPRNQRRNLPREAQASESELRWLQTLVDVIWPRFDKALSGVVGDQMDHLNEKVAKFLNVIRSVQSELSSLKLSKLTLGQVAPRLKGFSIIPATASDSEEITIDVKVEWNGNPAIVCQIEIFGLKIPIDMPFFIKVDKVYFDGVLRCNLKRVVEHGAPPFQQLVTISLLKIVKLTLDKNDSSDDGNAGFFGFAKKLVDLPEEMELQAINVLIKWLKDTFRDREIWSQKIAVPVSSITGDGRHA